MYRLYPGYIYLLSNICWKSIKKIGTTNNIARRVKELNVGLPEPIKIEYISSLLVDKYFYERKIIKTFLEKRYSPNREFFDINLEMFIIEIKKIEKNNNIYNNEKLLIEYLEKYETDYIKKRLNK